MCHLHSLCFCSEFLGKKMKKMIIYSDVTWNDCECITQKHFFPLCCSWAYFNIIHTHTHQFDRCTKIHPALPPSPPAPPSFWTRASQCPRPLSPLSLSDCSWQGCTASSSRCTAETEPRITHTQKKPHQIIHFWMIQFVNEIFLHILQKHRDPYCYIQAFIYRYRDYHQEILLP